MVAQNIESEEIRETVKVLLSLDKTSLMLVQTGARLLASRQEMEEAQGSTGSNRSGSNA